MRERCRLCGRFKSPADMTTTAVRADSGYRICHHCLAWHHQALLVLAGRKPPTACPCCHRSWEELQLGSGRTEHGLRMYLHGLDGVYVLLCKDCSDSIEQKKQQQFKGTPYGAAKKIF